jgi:hypothetical protein
MPQGRLSGQTRPGGFPKKRQGRKVKVLFVRCPDSSSGCLPFRAHHSTYSESPSHEGSRIRRRIRNAA